MLMTLAAWRRGRGRGHGQSGR